jgi:hypothetical protein
MLVPDVEKAMNAQSWTVSMRTDGSIRTLQQSEKRDRGDPRSDWRATFGVGEEPMKVELFYIDECPNYRAAARMVRETLREVGFRDEISEIKGERFRASRRTGVHRITLDSDRGEGYRGSFTAASLRTLVPNVLGKWKAGRRSATRHDSRSDLLGCLIGEYGFEGNMKHSEKIAPAAAVISALSTFACCLPVGIAAAAGAAGLGVIMEPLRPWLIGLSIALLGVGFGQLYRSRGTCQRRSRASVAVFWFSAIVVLAALVFPQALAGALADLLP